MSSYRDSRAERILLPADMELVVPPPPREEWEDGRPPEAAMLASRIGPFPPLVGGGRSRSDGEQSG